MSIHTTEPRDTIPCPPPRRLAALLTSVALLCATGSALADDAPRVKRPTVCVTGTPVHGGGFAGYLCTDGRRPRLFTKYIVVSFVDHDGRPASYVLGWVGAPVKAPAVKRIETVGL